MEKLKAYNKLWNYEDKIPNILSYSNSNWKIKTEYLEFQKNKNNNKRQIKKNSEILKIIKNLLNP